MRRLAERAELFRLIRAFFHEQGVLEVSAPLMAPHTVTDPHIQSFQVDDLFLQTSPEYAMKKWLAAGAGPIYSLGKVFRRGEVGTRHQPEFTMLEWYRPGWSLAELQSEVWAMIEWVSAALPFEPAVSCAPPVVTSYRALFEHRFDCNPHRASLGTLGSLAQKHFPDHMNHLEWDDEGARDDLLDLLFASGIEPGLVAPHFVTGFPATQAALANTGHVEGDEVALRSELYWQGLELANGYDELRDAEVLEARAARDNAIRGSRGLPGVSLDPELLSAMAGLPPCTGVALGVDRLLMLLCGDSSLR